MVADKTETPFKKVEAKKNPLDWVDFQTHVTDSVKDQRFLTSLESFSIEKVKKEGNGDWSLAIKDTKSEKEYICRVWGSVFADLENVARAASTKIFTATYDTENRRTIFAGA